MRYVEARFDEATRAEAYRFYVTKSLNLAPQGSWLEVSSYTDMFKPRDTRTGEDIVIDTMLGAGLMFEDDEK